MAKDIARQLRSFIRRSPKSVNAISQETGVSQSTLSRFVNGGEMSIQRAAKVAKVLGLELKRAKRVKMAATDVETIHKVKRRRKRRKRRVAPPIPETDAVVPAAMASQFRGQPSDLVGKRDW